MALLLVITQLHDIRRKTQKDLESIDTALAALGGGKKPQQSVGHKRVLSKDARRRIAEAQRLRWARFRKTGKHGKKAA